MAVANPKSFFKPSCGGNEGVQGTDGRPQKIFLEMATAAGKRAALIVHVVSEKGKIFPTVFHFCADAFLNGNKTYEETRQKRRKKKEERRKKKEKKSSLKSISSK